MKELRFSSKLCASMKFTGFSSRRRGGGTVPGRQSLSLCALGGRSNYYAERGPPPEHNGPLWLQEAASTKTGHDPVSGYCDENLRGGGLRVFPGSSLQRFRGTRRTRLSPKRRGAK